MSGSQELFELLARRARAREAERLAARPAEKPVGTKKQKKTSALPPPLARALPEAEPERTRPAEVAAEAAAPRLAAADAFVLSRRGAALLGILTALLVGVAFLAGERVGRAGGLGPAPMSALAKDPAAPDDGPERERSESPRAADPAPGPNETTYGIRVVTYEFNQANAVRASEVQEYLKSQGIRDVEARQNKDGTELRIYAGRYARQDDPALKSMLATLKSLRGDAKAQSKKDEFPFASAYIMKR